MVPVSVHFSEAPQCCFTLFLGGASLKPVQWSLLVWFLVFGPEKHQTYVRMHGLGCSQLALEFASVIPSVFFKFPRGLSSLFWVESCGSSCPVLSCTPITVWESREREK